MSDPTDPRTQPQPRAEAVARWDDEGGAVPAVAADGSGDAPYKSSPVFNEETLPDAVRREHRTKAGVWGVARVLRGQVKLRLFDPDSEQILDATHPGLILPEQRHSVEPLGRMRMQIEFYHQLPVLQT